MEGKNEKLTLVPIYQTTPCHIPEDSVFILTVVVRISTMREATEAKYLRCAFQRVSHVS
jgi:hypothetical protein